KRARLYIEIDDRKRGCDQIRRRSDGLEGKGGQQQAVDQHRDADRGRALSARRAAQAQSVQNRDGHATSPSLNENMALQAWRYVGGAPARTNGVRQGGRGCESLDLLTDRA